MNGNLDPSIVISLVSLATNLLLAVMNSKVRADVAEVKVYMHQNFLLRHEGLRK
jgi:hypothetical protein